MHRQSTGFVQHLFSSAFLVLLALQCTTAAQTVKMATTKLTATPASVRSGGQVTLSWSSTNASSCTGANFATGGAVSGTVKVNPTAMTTYTVNCGGAAAAQTVKMTTAKLTATPASVRSGGQVTLSWSSTNASSCTGANFATGGAVSGTVKLNPTAMTTYTVNCGGAAASQTVKLVTAKLTVAPASVRSGGQVTLSWYSTNPAVDGGELCHRGCGQRDGEVEPDGDDHLYGELRRGGGLANGEAGDCQVDGGACQCTQRGAGDVVLVQYQYQQLYGYELCHRGCGQRDGEVEPDGDDRLYGELRRGDGSANGDGDGAGDGAGDGQFDGDASQCEQRGAGDVGVEQ